MTFKRLVFVITLFLASNIDIICQPPAFLEIEDDNGGGTDCNYTINPPWNFGTTVSIVLNPSEYSYPDYEPGSTIFSLSDNGLPNLAIEAWAKYNGPPSNKPRPNTSGYAHITSFICETTPREGGMFYCTKSVTIPIDLVDFCTVDPNGNSILFGISFRESLMENQIGNCYPYNHEIWPTSSFEGLGFNAWASGEANCFNLFTGETTFCYTCSGSPIPDFENVTQKNSIISIADVVEIKDNSVYDNIRVFPNPFKELINIKIPVNNKSSKIEIYNIKGVLLNTLAFTQSEYVIETNLSMHNLPKGIYFCKVIQGREVSVIKLIKE
ncbi:MAG: T9SS type A sorting domain-containing protein [Bacteroidetes bacterium]|jgi:hypothetical protein|nr:T9SS type A sorting domain-containing protein [Bacteroidota bacterium]